MTDLVEFWGRAKRFARRRVPFGYEPDFAAYAVIYFCDWGNTDLEQIRVMFFRQVFGNRRSVSGRAKAEANLHPRSGETEIPRIIDVKNPFEEFEGLPLKCVENPKASPLKFTEYKFTEAQIAGIGNRSEVRKPRSMMWRQTGDEK